MWDHIQLYAALDCSLNYRFSRYLEAAFYNAAGLSSAFFFNLPDAAGTLVLPFFRLESGVAFIINPMFNFSIDIHPGVHYQQALGYLKIFDGFSFSLGTAVHFRFGEDPDIVRAGYRILKTGKKIINPVFAAMQSYYVNHPAGIISVENDRKEEIKDVEIAFFQAGFMDNATPCAVLPVIKSGEQVQVNLYASYNNTIFKTQGITPLVGEIQITCNYRGKSLSQSEPVTYDLYDKNSLVWDDDRKIAAFITPADRIIKNWGSLINQSGRELTLKYYNGQLQTAMKIYTAMDAAECLYQVDPITPYSGSCSENYAVDTVNFPRDTLEKITGDCDDLTVLYLSLLETLGVETGFITVPGHIFPVFNTGTRARDYSKLFPDREMSLNLNGWLWIPVEITLLGNHDFFAAWKEGIKNYQAWEKEPLSRKIYFTRQAQELFRPVALTEKEIAFVPGIDKKIRQGLESSIGELGSRFIEYYSLQAAREETDRNYNRLGIAYSIFREKAKAISAYRKALDINPGCISAWRNLGNLYYQEAEYAEALSCYMVILDIIDKDVENELYREILIQAALVYEQQGNLEKADEFYALAGAVEPGVAFNRADPESLLRSGNPEPGLFAPDYREWF